MLYWLRNDKYLYNRERTRREKVMKFLLHRKNMRWKALLMAFVILISVASPNRSG